MFAFQFSVYPFELCGTRIGNGAADHVQLVGRMPHLFTLYWL